MGCSAFEEFVRVLTLDDWPAADQTFDFGELERHPQPTPVGGKRIGGEPGRELVARERTIVTDVADDGVSSCGQRRLVETELCGEALSGRPDSWSGEVEEPADVVRGDEVPRRPQHVGAKDVATIEARSEIAVGQPWRTDTQPPTTLARGFRPARRADSPPHSAAVADLLPVRP